MTAAETLDRMRRELLRALPGYSGAIAALDDVAVVLLHARLR